jgi:hypothetical protein
MPPRVPAAVLRLMSDANLRDLAATTSDRATRAAVRVEQARRRHA